MEDQHDLTIKGRSERLLELSVFLRHVRQRVSPASEEIAGRRARRTKGLRRDEVAARAGISTDWYTRIEQGRDVNPSPEVLLAISNALNLNSSERNYLNALTSSTSGHQSGPPNDALGLALVADQMPRAPAFILDPSWTVLHQNHASLDRFGDWSKDEQRSPNFLVHFFTNPIFLHELEDWERHALLTVRQYRAVFAKRIEDQKVRNIVQSLSDDSRAFAKWWAEADVAGRDDGRKDFVSKDGEQTTYDYVMLRHCEVSDCELIAFVPRE